MRLRAALEARCQQKWAFMQLSLPLCAWQSVVVQSELESLSHSREWWSLLAVVPSHYKQRQGERKGKHLREQAAKASANAHQPVQASAHGTGATVGEAAARGSGDTVTG